MDAPAILPKFVVILLETLVIETIELLFGIATLAPDCLVEILSNVVNDGKVLDESAADS